MRKHRGRARVERGLAWKIRHWRRHWRGLEVLEIRALLDASPYGLTSFTPLGNDSMVIAGPGGLNGVPQFDLNGDGLGDMIVLYDNDSGAADSTRASVSAMLMRADGSAKEYHIAQYTIPNNAGLPVVNQVIVADINGDGQPDVAVLHNNGATLSTHKWVDLFIGQTDGTFTASVPVIDLGTNTATPTLAVFDQNGDGKVDLVLAEPISGTFTVYRGNGDGTFAAKATTSLLLKVSGITNYLFQQDVSGDGVADLVVSGGVPTTGKDGLFVFKGQSNGTFSTTASFSDTTDDLTLLGLQQLSSDNLPDIIAYSAPQGSNHNVPASLFVFRATGSGAFAQSFHSPTFGAGLLNEYSSLTNSKLPLQTPDLDSDGDPEMIITEGPGTTGTVTLHIEINNGNAGFTQAQQISFTSVVFGNPPKIVDVDHDGKLDLVVYSHTGNNGTVATTVYFNQGNGTFGDPGVVPSPTLGVGKYPALADFNGDGKLDFLFISGTAPITAQVLLNDTGRTFKPGVDTTITNGINLSQERDIPADPVLDYTGDGLADLLVYINNAGGTVSNGVKILASSSDGHFTLLSPAVTFGNVQVAQAPVATDFNDDGKIDLLFGDTTGLVNLSAGGIFVSMNGATAPVDTAGKDTAHARDLGTINAPLFLTEFVNTTVNGGTYDQEDYFKFTLSSQKTIRITARGDVGHVALLLDDALGNGLNFSNANPAVMNATLDAGTYFIGVQHDSGADTNYRLDIGFPALLAIMAVQEGFSTIISGQQNAVDFGDVIVTTTDTTHVFTVRNDGQTVLHISSVDFPNGFTFGSDTLVSTLAPGASDTFSAVMITATEGTYSGDISIHSDDVNTPFHIPVSGKVEPLPAAATPLPLIVVSASGSAITSGQLVPVDLGSVEKNGTAPQVTFTVANSGNDTLTASALQLPTGFSLAEGLSASILPGQSDTFTVKLTSTAAIADFAGNITFTNNSEGASNTFTLPIAAHVTPIVVLPPDLSGAVEDVLIGKLSVTSGVMAIPGDKITLKLHLVNNGSGNLLAGHYGIAISASDDQVLDGGDTLIQTLSVTLPALASGASKDVTLTVTLSKTMPAGDVFFIADLDPANALTESDETNNAAAAAQALPVVLEAGQVGSRSNVKLTLQQANGTLVTFTVTKGTVIVTVVDALTGLMDLDAAGTGVTVSVTSKPAAVGGPNQITFRNISIHDATSLAGPLVAAAPPPAPGTFTATTAQLTGTLEATNGLKSLSLASADGATITIGVAANPTATISLTIGTVNNTSLDSQMKINTLTAVNWLDDDSDADTITAPSITTVKINGNTKASVAGNFQADLTLSGIAPTTLKTFTATGVITGVNWNITGAVGSITAARLIDSTIYAGVNPVTVGLPSQLSDFNSADTLSAIKTLTLMGVKGSTDSDFINSIVAAKSITTASLGRIATLNSGTPLGLAGHTMGTVYFIDSTGKKVKHSLTPDGDFEIHVI